MKKYNQFRDLEELLPPGFKRTAKVKPPKVEKAKAEPQPKSEFPYAEYLAIWERLFRENPETISAEYIHDNKKSLMSANPDMTAFIKLSPPGKHNICRWVIKEREAGVNFSNSTFIDALIKTFEREIKDYCTLVFDNKGGFSILNVPDTGVRIEHDSKNDITYIKL